MRAGLGEFIEHVRFRRHRFRQFVGGLFYLVVLIEARPVAWGLVVGGALAAVGMAIRLWASGHVRKDRELATDGPYALCRHPLYLGNLLLGVGYALASGLWWALAVWALTYWLYYLPAVWREDDKLGKLFPDAWFDWADVTPALIPRRLRLQARGWSLLQCARNGDPLYALVLAAAFYNLYARLP